MTNDQRALKKLIDHLEQRAASADTRLALLEAWIDAQNPRTPDSTYRTIPPTPTATVSGLDDVQLESPKGGRASKKK